MMGLTFKTFLPQIPNGFGNSGQDLIITIAGMAREGKKKIDISVN